MALIATVAGCTGLPARAREPLRPLAVALVQTQRGSELVTVDLERFAIVRRTRLRSLCLAIDADPHSSRFVVTAQCGGPDRAADSAAGICDVDRGSVSYVELGAPNPAEVAVAGTRALLVHGLERGGRTFASVVDVRERVLETTLGLPAGTCLPVRAGRDVVFIERERAGSLLHRMSLDEPTGFREATPTAVPAADVTAVVSAQGPDAAGRLLVVAATQLTDGSRREAARVPRWRVYDLRGQEGSLMRGAAVPGVTHGVFQGCFVGDEVALADADGLDVADPGRTVRLIGARSLARTGAITVDGMPAALAEWNGHLLVFDGITGELLLYPRGSDRPARGLRLGGAPLGTGDLVVMD